MALIAEQLRHTFWQKRHQSGALQELHGANSSRLLGKWALLIPIGLTNSNTDFHLPIRPFVSFLLIVLFISFHLPRVGLDPGLWLTAPAATITLVGLLDNYKTDE